jgi:hypothetical protein
MTLYTQNPHVVSAGFGMQVQTKHRAQQMLGIGTAGTMDLYLQLEVSLAAMGAHLQAACYLFVWLCTWYVLRM